MLMPASEAYRRLQEEISDDLDEINDDIESAIKNKSSFALVRSEIFDNEAIRKQLKLLGYR